MKEEPEPPSCHSFPAHELEKCTRMDAGDSAEFQPQAEVCQCILGIIESYWPLCTGIPSPAEVPGYPDHSD